MPEIYLSLFAYGLPDDLLAAFASANQSDVTWLLFLHSQIPAVVTACETLAKHNNVIYFAYGTNRGGARSLNEAICRAQDDAADVFIVWQDDLYARPGDIALIANSMLANPDCSYAECEGYVQRTGRTEWLGLTGGAINLRAIDRVGYFDQNFWPMYFDDTDWRYRAKLAGLSSVRVPGAYLTHAGSKTHTDVQPEKFDEYFYPNKAYYENKWGGDGGSEQFTTPFNAPALDWNITRDRIDNPYPGRGKT